MVFVHLSESSSAAAQHVPPKRLPVHYLWAALITRIYEVCPLLCPIWGGRIQGALLSALKSAGIRGLQPAPGNSKMLVNLLWCQGGERSGDMAVH